MGSGGPSGAAAGAGGRGLSVKRVASQDVFLSLVEDGTGTPLAVQGSAKRQMKGEVGQGPHAEAVQSLFSMGAVQ